MGRSRIPNPLLMGNPELHFAAVTRGASSHPQQQWVAEEEEEFPGRYGSGLSVSTGGAKRRKRTDSVSGSVVKGEGEMVSKLKRGDLDWS